MEKYLSDQELLTLCQNKESQSYGFNLLVRKYQKRLYFHIRKMVLIHEDSDDLLQQTFIKAWKGIMLFRGESQLYTWLFRIASNVCIDFLNTKKKRMNISLEEVEKSI